MDISLKKLKELYKEMLKIRLFEQAAIRLWDQGKIKGSIHPYIGQEAIAVGVCQVLKKNDYIVSSHRGHGHYLAKGGSSAKMMAELLGKTTGCCKGRGGSMHVADMETFNIGANGLVAAGMGIATGVALSSKLKKLDCISVAFFGEGATSQGMFHESLNIAAIWKLPVLFICENNKYAVSTDCNYSLPVKNVSERSKAYNIPGITIDGNDVIEVYKTVKRYIGKIRNGKGPVLMECKTYRWEGHYHGEPQVYRDKGEIEKWKKECPIIRLEKFLLDNKFPKNILDNIRGKVEKEMADAVEFAEKSPDNTGEEIYQYLYAD